VVSDVGEGALDASGGEPEYLSHQFRKLIKALDLPPIRLHDLRHGAATLALAAHTDLKVIQQMLGHSASTPRPTPTPPSYPKWPTPPHRPQRI
jgi:integrase